MRRLGILLAVVAALAPAAAAQTPRTTHDVLPVFVSPGAQYTSGVDFTFVGTKGHAHNSLARSLAVFGRPPKAGDALPARLQHVFTAPNPTITPQPAKSRLLLVVGDASIYAEPTKQGSVCYFLFPPGSGSCTESLRHGALPQVTSGLVWGLVDNGAAAVDVHLPASSWVHARLGENAFYLRLPDNILAPTEILVRERNGVRHIYTIKRCTIAQIKRPPC